MVGACSMRFLLYTHEFPPETGGAGLYTAYLAKGLTSLGHEVTVLAHRKGDAEDHQRGYTVRRIRMPKDLLARGLLGATRMLWERIAREPDVVIVTEATAQVAGALASQLYGIAVHVTCHGSEVPWWFTEREHPLTRLAAARVRRLFHEAPAIFCVSEGSRRLLLDAAPELAERTHVIPNGIDLDRFQEVSDTQIETFRQRHGVAGPMLLTVGRLIAEKGHDTVLAALPALLEEKPELTYVVVGGGPDEERLRELADELGVADHVRFLGKVPDEELQIAYAASDVFVMISRPGERIEGFGLVYAEAAVYGTPVVAGDTGGVSEIVEDGENGFLVPPDDVQAAADAIRDLLEDPERAARMGRRGRELVEERFTCERMAERLLEHL